jgi:Uncharacterized conserved protein
LNNRNRGKQSSDDQHFAPKWHPVFTQAVDDLCWLLTRGYNENSAIQLVGNRYRLNKRQRQALLRVSCDENDLSTRQLTELKAKDLKNKIVEIDGFNLLILLESALSGAFIFKARDGLYRDISSVHGSYKRVIKTEEAIILTGKILMNLEVASVKWYLDQPVSNSGRLKTRILELGAEHQFNWSVELVFDPDKVLAKSKNVVVSSDGWILNQAENWFNLGVMLVEDHIQEVNVLAF